MEEEGTVVACGASFRDSTRRGKAPSDRLSQNTGALWGSVRNVESRTAFGRGRVPPEESSVLGFICRSTHSERGREGGREGGV